MESFAKDVLKQSNKIKRILTKILKTHSELTEELDVAIYATNRIDKIIQKNSISITIDRENKHTPIVSSAHREIQIFQQNFQRLVKNVNKIQEAYSSSQLPIVTQSRKIIQPYENERTQERQKISHLPTKNKLKHSKKRILDLSQQRNDLSDLSELDANILELAQRIAECVRQQSIQE